MTPWQWLRAAFGGEEGARESRPQASLRYEYGTDRLVDDDELYLGGVGGSASYATGGQFGHSTRASTYAGRSGEVLPALQSAVQLISQTIATCPRTVVDGQGRQMPEHAVTMLLNHGDRDWPASAVWEYLIRSSLMFGWGVAWAPRIRAAGGRMRIYPCDPLQSQVRVSEDNRTRMYQLVPLVGPRRVDVPSQDVLLIVGDGYNGLRGLSPLLAYSLTTGVLRSANAHLYSTLQKGVSLSGVMEMAPEIAQASGFDLKRMQELRGEMSRMFAGDRAAGQAPALPPGVTWKHVPYSAVDIELVRLLELSIEDVCRIYRVPPRLLYHYRQGIRYSDDAEQSNTEWQTWVKLRTDMLGDFVGSQFLTPQDRAVGLRVDFGTDHLGAGTVSQRIAAMDQSVARSMLMTPNEGREYLMTGKLPRLDPLPDGDELRQPKGAPEQSGMDKPGATEAGEQTEPTEAGE